MSPAQSAKAAQQFAQTRAKLASGMKFQLAGETAAVADVPASKGWMVTSSEPIRMTVVQQSERTLAFRSIKTSGTRAPSYLVNSGGTGDCTWCAGPTPAPAPPNVDSCSAAGGVAWEDAEGGVGCLGSGSSRTLSCGTWEWAGAGRGRILFGGDSYVYGSWISDMGDGSCTLGA